MKKVAILLCEDDVNYGTVLCEFLCREGYLVEWVRRAEEAWYHVNHNLYDLCIFEVALPDKSGLELVRDIRLVDPDLPVLFLSSRSKDEDILAGYRAGADDYLTKPCLMELLHLKILSIVRRIHHQRANAQTEYVFGEMVFNSVTQLLTKGSQSIRLSTRESDLLQMLLDNPNGTVERSYILKKIWKTDNYFSTRSLSVYINHLRKILSIDPSVTIQSVHGRGYKIILPNS